MTENFLIFYLLETGVTENRNLRHILCNTISKKLCQHAKIISKLKKLRVLTKLFATYYRCF
jgi:hypothetical protein